MDSGYVPVILTVVIGAVLVFLAAKLNKFLTLKAEDKARVGLQAVLDPGEQLIGFTKGNTKGASATTVMLAGWLGAAISRAGNMEIYVGLTSRHLILTPVKQPEGSRSVQVISCETIKGFDVAYGIHGGSTLTTHTRNGDLVVYIPNDQGWLRKASALKNAFAGR